MTRALAVSWAKAEVKRRPPLAPLAPHQPRPASELHSRWSAEAWLIVRVEFRRALALRSEIRRAGWSTSVAALVRVAPFG